VIRFTKAYRKQHNYFRYFYWAKKVFNNENLSQF
jgi:hypothetical protein